MQRLYKFILIFPTSLDAWCVVRNTFFSKSRFEKGKIDAYIEQQKNTVIVRMTKEGLYTILLNGIKWHYEHGTLRTSKRSLNLVKPYIIN